MYEKLFHVLLCCYVGWSVCLFAHLGDCGVNGYDTMQFEKWNIKLWNVLGHMYCGDSSFYAQLIVIFLFDVTSENIV
jgi:hypothetical protein